MEADTLRIELACDDQAAKEVRDAFVPDVMPRFIERRDLSGDTATWIVMATLTLQALPHMLDFMIKWKELGRVKRIKIGDVEIENPSLQDVEQLRNKFGPAAEQQHGK